ncbi:probable xyloglucan endotransglucosylase/hydrolase protein 33 [Magnolia sinica]|uniref:probable xyloglucan endotransglucosylase/hydrolase protein 33 n=1 Tax=Magnolia sinica TaxID=86752 RepID=UPI0026599E9C|nr:probable xyloglucan endotransglucosylase/hydrolase protein 33 [Magnolia sinica]
MPISANKLLFVQCLISCVTVAISAGHGHFSPPILPRFTDLFPHLTFNGSYSEFFGGPTKVRPSNDGSRIDLILDKSSGSGFVSKDHYYYGFFSAAIKLPPDYTAGVVVAFYMSNADVSPHTHDEIDFELLGHEKRKEWALQTNVYGNGSSTGREEKFYLWFDPTQEYHRYSILWNQHHIVFLVDNIPIREVNHSQAMSGAYPSKPMAVYSTIWDGSKWATHGGKRPVDYKYAPFQVSFTELEMDGCKWNRTMPVPLCSKNGQDDQSSSDPITGDEFVSLSQQQKVGMEQVRKSFMFYSYCEDRARFSVLPPECNERK